MILQNVLGSFAGQWEPHSDAVCLADCSGHCGHSVSSVVRVTFPLMAKHAAAGDLRAQRKTFLDSIRLLTIVGLPVCIWLTFARDL